MFSAQRSLIIKRKAKGSKGNEAHGQKVQVLSGHKVKKVFIRQSMEFSRQSRKSFFRPE